MPTACDILVPKEERKGKNENKKWEKGNLIQNKVHDFKNTFLKAKIPL
jgi:hypothetical protein